MDKNEVNTAFEILLEEIKEKVASFMPLLLKK